MNRALFLATYESWLSRPVRLIAVCLLFFIPLAVELVIYANIPDSASQSIPPGQGAPLSPPVLSALYVLILGSGIVGIDLSSGVLTVNFTRPIKRSDYVLTKWLALAVAAAVLGIMQGLAEQAVIFANLGMGIGDAFIFNIAERVSIAFGLSSVLVFISTLISGGADVLLWITLRVVGGATHLTGDLLQNQAMKLMAGWEDRLFYPCISIGHNSLQLAGDGLVYASCIAFFLSLAILVMNRKEFSYAS